MKPFDALQLTNALHAILIREPVLTISLIDARDDIRLSAHAVLSELIAAELPFEFRRRDLETSDN